MFASEHRMFDDKLMCCTKQTRLGKCCIKFSVGFITSHSVRVTGWSVNCERQHRTYLYD
jgi:hypothetical protein